MDKKKNIPGSARKILLLEICYRQINTKNKQKTLLVIKEALHNNKMNNFLGRYMDSGLLCA